MDLLSNFCLPFADDVWSAHYIRTSTDARALFDFSHVLFRFLVTDLLLNVDLLDFTHSMARSCATGKKTGETRIDALATWRA